MNEKLLSFIWQQQYFNKFDLKTVEGESLEVVFPGTLNTNQGPDFLEATIKIGKHIWSGAVELHVVTSDWDVHGHQHDKNYKNVVLHVVWRNNLFSVNSLPILELEPRVPSHLLNKYVAWMDRKTFIPCSNELRLMDSRIVDNWFHWVSGIWIDDKQKAVLELVGKCNFDWEEAFWQAIAKNFGYRVNGDSFAQLAASIPVKILYKHHHNLPQLEALFFGQSNLINNQTEEDYPKMLEKEYQFLQSKYRLIPINQPIFFHRMRPGNFPTIRLAQLAALLHQTSPLFARILSIKQLSGLKMLLGVTANDFWHYHYRFEESTAYKIKTAGNQLVDSVIINTVIPFLIAYGKSNNNIEFVQRAEEWLGKMPPESNSITLAFNELGIYGKNAAQAQAMMYNKKNYCKPLRCLDCGIGKYILKKNGN
jgi:hypothetical protein